MSEKIESVLPEFFFNFQRETSNANKSEEYQEPLHKK